MKLSFTISASLALGLGSVLADKTELEPIFNGEDLTGWTAPKDNIWFSVKDGVLLVKNGPKKKGQTLWTTGEYTDFAMEFDFKMGEGTVDSGVYIKLLDDCFSDPGVLGACRSGLEEEGVQ